MNILLPELFNIICDNILCITDIRNLSRVCINYDKVCKKRVNELENFYKKKYDGLLFTVYLIKPCVEKYTVEIILDNYYNLLSEIYYNKNNKVICNMLAFVGNLELLKIAYSKLCPITSTIFNCAAYNGHVDVLEWITANTKLIPDEGSVSLNSGAGGHINVLEWMQKLNHDIHITPVVFNAARNGHLHIFQWLKSNNIIINVDFAEDAAQRGHLHILKWAHENKYITDNNFCIIAADYGHVNILKWAFDNKLDIDIYDYECIVENGHTNVLQWLFDNNFNIDKNIYRMAIKSGKINVLQWIHEHEFTLTNNDLSVLNDDILSSKPPILQLAILYDQPLVIQWSMKGNYELDNLTYEYLIEKKKVNILGWLITKNLIYITKINYKKKYDSIIDLIVTYRDAIIDKVLSINLLSLNTDVIQTIIKKYNNFKKPYHFILSDTEITINKYKKNNICNEQKIICCYENGNAEICNFGNECSCWWYFLMNNKNKYNTRNFIKINISKCELHGKYAKFLKL
jgi:hypothetical protein